MAVEKANFEINRMARLLEVSRSGYYRWVARRDSEPGPQAARRNRLDAHVRQVFTDSGQVYGAPRVNVELHKQGVKVDVKTVATSMRRQGLEGISPRMFTPIATIPGVPTHQILDLVNAKWDTGELNRVWISDITYLRTGEGWLFLCVVRDACSRRVLGWAMDTHQNTDLVERALRTAKILRGNVPSRIIFHADRGTQFTSEQLHRVCNELDIDQSMGRTGVCFDNAMAESFWATLKTEFYNRRAWPTRAQARTVIAKWIEVVYNRHRLHSSLGYLTPVDYEHNLNKQNQSKASTEDKAA